MGKENQFYDDWYLSAYVEASPASPVYLTTWCQSYKHFFQFAADAETK